MPYSSDVQIDEVLKALLKSTLDQIDKSAEHEINPFSITFKAKSGLRAHIPSSGLWYALCFSELYGAVNDYRKTIIELKGYLSSKGYKSQDIDSYLKQFPSTSWGENVTAIEQDYIAGVNEVLSEQSDKDLFGKFMSDRDWWIKTERKSDGAKGKTLDRSDVYESSIALACNLVVANSSKLKLLIQAFHENKDLANYFENMHIKQFDFQVSTVLPEEKISEGLQAVNVIFYGAPGTGKSYKIDQTCDTSNSVRTVFHPDYQYSDFIGYLKPGMNGDNVIYQFRPGVFTLALKLAANSPDKMMYLVIEEINRASAAAVFGEIFQLLDREPSGKSKYEITLTEPDLINYLNDYAPSLLNGSNLKIPANLSILATMNSSDQAVMPMDTAFKRRWKFEYIPIDFTSAPTGTIKIPVGSNNAINISWKDFATSINGLLEEENIPEDRLLGPWFLSKPELETIESATNSLKGKLLLYLWDDVLRHGEKSLIFSPDIKTYGGLIKALENGDNILSDRLESILKGKAMVDTGLNQVKTDSSSEEST